MLHVVIVRPHGAGWCVEAETLAAPLIFKSGAKAEAAAERLATALSSTGKWAEIQVFAKDWKLAGRYACPPKERPDNFDEHLSNGAVSVNFAASREGHVVRTKAKLDNGSLLGAENYGRQLDRSQGTTGADRPKYERKQTCDTAQPPQARMNEIMSAKAGV